MITVYVVFQWFDEKPNELQGVFSTEQKAIAECKEQNYGYGPVVLDKPFPAETCKWEGYKYPLFEVPK